MVWSGAKRRKNTKKGNPQIAMQVFFELHALLSGLRSGATQKRHIIGLERGKQRQGDTFALLGCSCLCVCVCMYVCVHLYVMTDFLF